MKPVSLIILLVFMWVVGCGENNPEPDDPFIEEPPKESHHPFLIVNKDQFQALRDKSTEEPWKSMKSDAIARSGAGTSDDAYRLQEYVGAAALAFILDEDNAAVHADRVRSTIVNKYSKLDIEESTDWGKVVKPMGSLFCAILALDIVYDSLSNDEIKACEDVISTQIFKVKREGSWKDVRYGTHGTWDIYKGDRTEKDDKYFESVIDQITDDGVSPVTIHYAWERVGGGDSRVSKSGYMDVLEFTGIDNRYYNNEKLKKFQRWLFGSSVNCNKEMAIIGDMLPNQNLNNDMLHRRVVNFDMEAAGYAAWFYKDRPAIGHMLTYILPKQALPDPVTPSSKIYHNGGAFFRESADDPNGLHAVLYNIKSQDEWHTHNEVNGLALSGYNNRLLVNGGRLGQPTRAAYLNNTLTINGENHDSRLGNGITAGFTGDGVDFALGNAGPAFASANHNRSLVLLQENDGARGYFILFDEVAASSGDQIKNYLHPANETNVSEVSALKEYDAAIDHFQTKHGSKLAFYYVTPPKEVNIEKVASAVPDRYPGYPDHNRLEAVYDTDANGNKNLATILFPFSTTFSKATFSTLEGIGYHGCLVTQGNVTDYVFEANEDQFTSEGITAKATFSLVREVDNQMVLYMVKNGHLLSTNGVGFTSDSPITMYARGSKGSIISDGAKVKITGSGMGNVQFDAGAQVLDSGADFIEVQLPAGMFAFE